MRELRIILAIGITGAVFNISATGLYAQGEPGNRAIAPAADETYLGQNPPGKKAVAFAPDVLIHEAHDSPVISPDEKWLLFQGMDVDILFYGMVNGLLTDIKNPLNIEFPEVCNGVAISPSGNRFYIEEWVDGQNYLYYIDRDGDGWTSSMYVDLGSPGNWWQISIATSGNLYFARENILVSSFKGGSHLEPVALKLEDGRDMNGGYPFISPDESYIVFSIEGNLHISYRLKDEKWTEPRDLGPDINSNHLDICPQITPNGKYLFFTTRRNFPDFKIYWADADFVEQLRPSK